MTLDAFIREGKAKLEETRAECGDPQYHLRLLVEGVLGWNSAEIIRRGPQVLAPQEQAPLEKAFARRLAGEPLQYILGYADFWKERFHVGPGVLIPRPETECLVEKALELLPSGSLRIAELGPGTGAIGISLLQERAKWDWYCWELNPASIPYIRKNVVLLERPVAFTLFQGDFFALNGGVWDALISNPPYVARGEMEGLSREVRQEPVEALDGGESGLEIVHKLIDVGKKGLVPGGALLLEIGSDQGAAVLEALQQAGYVSSAIFPDLAGKDRIAYGRRP
ncbi:peptide chain release factor N(5)-glutamine methyltransferase [bacterium]|nr:peptide chain release factor N(5)-glutamine methyltransferase [bacterium]